MPRNHKRFFARARRLDAPCASRAPSVAALLAAWLCAAFMALLAGAPPAAAQLGALTGDGGADPAVGEAMLDSPEAVREMVARLSDREVRDLLLRRLDAVVEARAEAESKSGTALDFLMRNLVGAGMEAVEMIIAAPRMMNGLMSGVAEFSGRRGPMGTAIWLGVLAGALVIGLIGEFLVNRLSNGWKRRIRQSAAEDLRGVLALLARRCALDFIGLAVFFGLVYAVIWNVMPPKPLFNREAAWQLVISVVMYPRVMFAISRFVLAPRRRALRLLNTDDDTARYLHRNLIILALIKALPVYLLPFLASHGVKVGDLTIGVWLNFLFYGWLIVVFWRAREGLAMMMRARDAQPRPTDMLYPYGSIALVAATWLFVLMLLSADRFDLLGHRIDRTLLLLLLTPIFDTALRGLVRHLAPPMLGEGPVAEQAHRSALRAYLRIGRAIVAALVIRSVADIWGLQLGNIAARGLGANFASGFVEFLLIVAIGYLAWEVTTLWINRKLAAERSAGGGAPEANAPGGGGEGGGFQGGSRLTTVLPLLSLALQVVIVMLTVLFALGNLGIDVTPLLAGAGIVGIAIGFGAQKLVADVVAGLFFLIDDAFRIGEYVDVEGTMGTVERITIRSLQLRHHRGAVHTIPFGEIPRITNYSRDWVIMKLRFTVPFDTDLNKVKKLFKQIGQDMMKVPEFAADFLQPFKSQGVLEVDDVGIVIRGKFATRPGKQFLLRKEIFARVQKAFDENGIQFARKEVRVNVGGLDGGHDLDEAQQHAVGAAAAEAADAQKKAQQAAGAGTGAGGGRPGD